MRLPSFPEREELGAAGGGAPSGLTFGRTGEFTVTPKRLTVALSAGKESIFCATDSFCNS